RHPAVRTLERARLVYGGPQRERLESDRHGEHDDRDERRREVVRVPDLLDALIEREQPARGEQHQGNEETEDVTLAAVAERVLRGGAPARRAGTEEQQTLVAGVHDGVHALGKHRRRSGDRERDELDERNAEIRPERGNYRPGATARAQCTDPGRHARPPSADLRRASPPNGDLRPPRPPSGHLPPQWR